MLLRSQSFIVIVNSAGIEAVQQHLAIRTLNSDLSRPRGFPQCWSCSHRKTGQGKIGAWMAATFCVKKHKTCSLFSVEHLFFLAYYKKVVCVRVWVSVQVVTYPWKWHIIWTMVGSILCASLRMPALLMTVVHHGTQKEEASSPNLAKSLNASCRSPARLTESRALCALCVGVYLWSRTCLGSQAVYSIRRKES
jgi:hypothetical protein